jgi:hypothetical protein
VATRLRLHAAAYGMTVDVAVGQAVVRYLEDAGGGWQP